LHASYVGFWPYLFVALALLPALSFADTLAAWIFLPYVLYLGYAIWWGRRLWRLNGVRATSNLIVRCNVRRHREL
jgi:tryptophan-rich sensory protein